MSKEEQELLEKWDVHRVVQEAVSKAHTEPSQRTLDMFNKLNDKLDNLDERGHKILEELAVIKISAKHTEDHLATLNGKVAKNVERLYSLEKDNEDSKLFISKYQGDKNDEMIEVRKRKFVLWERFIGFLFALVLALVGYLIGKL